MYAFIVNPNARSGLGIQIWRQLEEILKERNVAYDVYITRYPGHATDFARELTAGEDAPTLVVLGGDGTINEAVDGIRDLSKVAFAYIPIGSSNDFARSMKLSKDPVAALEHILDPSEYAYINIGSLSYGDQRRRFAVSSGIGYDADVCVYNQGTRLKKLMNRLKLGKVSYTAIALMRLLQLRPGNITLKLDNGKTRTFHKAYFITAMNQRYEGGGFKFCPMADPSDDLLDIIVISGLPKLKALLLLPTAYSGAHVRYKGVYTYSCKTAEIHADTPLPVHTDGEVAARESSITLSLEPEKLRLICS